MAEIESSVLLEEHEIKLFQQFQKIQKIEVESRITKGQSRAKVYIVLIFRESRISLAIAKINKKKATSKDEIVLHKSVLSKIENSEISRFVPKIIDDAIVDDWYGAIYELAGDTHLESTTLNYGIYNELPTIAKVCENVSEFLYNWNLPYNHDDVNPLTMIRDLLGPRFLDERMLTAFSKLGIRAEEQWLIFGGIYEVFPNPLYFLTNESLLDIEIPCLLGSIHGDLHGNNIMITDEEGISIIDFGNFQESGNIFYDHRYLELHLLLTKLSVIDNDQRLFWKDLCSALASTISTDFDIPPGPGSLIFRSVLTQLRNSIKERITTKATKKLYEPSFYLAGVAAGLNYFRKTPEEDKRFAALLYTVYNLLAFIKHPSIVLTYQNSLQWLKQDQTVIIKS